ncbi:MAG: MarR family transcriptional regulator [Pirellulaceae bacterium]
MKEKTGKERELPMALRAAYMALHRNTDAAFAAHGVTADQFVLLLALRDGHALTQRELADRISSDSSTVRAMLVLLEKRGLVRRDRHATDSRAKTVSLTTAGKQKRRKLWKAGQEIRDAMHGALTTADAEVLVGLLQRVACALNREKLLA